MKSILCELDKQFANSNIGMELNTQIRKVCTQRITGHIVARIEGVLCATSRNYLDNKLLNLEFAKTLVSNPNEHQNQRVLWCKLCRPKDIHR